MFSNFVDLLIILTLNSNKLVTKGCQNIYNYIFYLNSKSKNLLVSFINLPNNKIWKFLYSMQQQRNQLFLLCVSFFPNSFLVQ